MMMAIIIRMLLRAKLTMESSTKTRRRWPGATLQGGVDDHDVLGGCREYRVVMILIAVLPSNIYHLTLACLVTRGDQGEGFD